MTKPEKNSSGGALLTDHYQLTMAHLYFELGLHEQPVQFDHFFRHYPDYGGHRAGYCINAGLAWFLDWLEGASFAAGDIRFLRDQVGQSGRPLFSRDFLAWLADGFSLDAVHIHAIPEGRVVHPHIPLTLVQGPLAVAQIIETALLNQLNYQTLVATKASRLRQSARGQSILEFGLRRGHGLGANAGARAALIGGADFSSNVGLSRQVGLAPKGTHAHSMVQALMANGMSEQEAFRAYAGLYPDDCLLLVDTIDTVTSGVPNAIAVFDELRAKGHRPVGIRIDSGELAELVIAAAAKLQEAGYTDQTIVVSDNLDELAIAGIMAYVMKNAGRNGLDSGKLIERLSFGVGTKLITSEGAPALGGIYKLAAVQTGAGWQPVAKTSDSPLKTTTPGLKKAWRLSDEEGRSAADLIALSHEAPLDAAAAGVYLAASGKEARAPGGIRNAEALLQPVMRAGVRVSETPDLAAMRRLRDQDLAALDTGFRHLIDPAPYPVFLSEALWRLRLEQTRRPNGGRDLDP